MDEFLGMMEQARNDAQPPRCSKAEACKHDFEKVRLGKEKLRRRKDKIKKGKLQIFGWSLIIECELLQPGGKILEMEKEERKKDSELQREERRAHENLERENSKSMMTSSSDRINAKKQ